VPRSQIFKLPERLTPVLLALLAALVTIVFMSTGIMKGQELASYDLRCRWRPDREPGKDVFLLVVDEGLVQSNLFGSFPWSRDIWAGIQSKHLDPLKPHSIVYDILFDIEDRKRVGDPDWVFAKAIENSGNVLLASTFLKLSLEELTQSDYRAYQPDWMPPSPGFIRRFALDGTRVATGRFYHGTAIVRPLTDFESGAAGVGHTTTPPDFDGITRRYPLVVEYDGEYYPALPLVAVCRYLGLELGSVRTYPGDFIALPKADGTEIRVPIDQNGNFLMNFYGRELTIFPSESMVRFLDAMESEDPKSRAKVDPDQMTGKIVVIGSIAASTFDLRPVTIHQSYPLMGNVATVIVNILRGDFLIQVGPWMNAIIIFLVAVLLAGLSQRSHQLFSPYLRDLPAGFLGLFAELLVILLPTLALAAAYTGASYFILSYFNLVIPLFYAVFCLFFTSLLLAIYNFLTEEGNKRWYESTWGRYMSPEMIQQLRDNPEQLNLGGGRAGGNRAVQRHLWLYLALRTPESPAGRGTVKRVLRGDGCGHSLQRGNARQVYRRRAHGAVRHTSDVGGGRLSGGQGRL